MSATDLKGAILALDPGTEKTAYLILSRDGRSIRSFGWEDNAAILAFIQIDQYTPGSVNQIEHLAIEQVRSYGMAIGKSTLDTVEWSGRFIQAFLTPMGREGRVLRIPRLEIKVNLCRSARAKDANVRQALIDRFGAPGTKRNPGPTYGISKHIWSALAVAVTAYDMLGGET